MAGFGVTLEVEVAWLFSDGTKRIQDVCLVVLEREERPAVTRLHRFDSVGSWLAGAKMPTELRKWAWMTGVAGNAEVKSDYRDSYPDQRREGWDV